WPMPSRLFPLGKRLLVRGQLRRPAYTGPVRLRLPGTEHRAACGPGPALVARQQLPVNLSPLLLLVVVVAYPSSQALRATTLLLLLLDSDVASTCRGLQIIR